MKRIAFIFGVFALVTASAISCQKETPVEEAEKADKNKQEQPKPETPTLKTLTFKITDGEDTKMTLSETDGKKHGAWESGDFIGFVANNGTVEPVVPNDSNKAEVDNSTTPPTFTVSPANGLSNGLSTGNKLCFWYPYRSNQTNPSAVQLVIPAAQTQDATLGFDFDAMPMVAEPLTVTSAMADVDSYAGNIQFANLGSVICFKVFSSNATYATEKVTSVSFNAESAIAGHFNFDLAGVDFSNETTLACSGYSARSVTTTLSAPVSIGANKDDAADIYMIVAPGSHSGTIVVATDAAFYTYTLPSRDFSRSGLKSFGLDLGKTPSVRSLKYAHTWDLTQVSYSSASTSSVQWAYGLINLTASKVGSATAANSWLPPQKTDTKFYTNNSLSFSTPILQIEKVEYTAKDETNATTMANSTWTNANARSSESIIATIIPIDGSASFSATTGLIEGTKMKVYFDNTDYSIGKTAVEHGSFTVKKGEDEVSSAKVNTTITLTATPDDGYSLTGWTVTDSGDDAVSVVGNTFQMPASNVTVSASFSAALHTISIADYSHGSVSTSPSGSAAEGATVTITANPDSGYSLYSLTVKDADNGDISVDENKQFTMPDKNVTITAVFYPIYTITLDANASGSNNVHWLETTVSPLTKGDGVNWAFNVTWDNNESTSWGNNKTFVKIGAEGNAASSVTLSTSDILGTILSVSVTCSSGDGKHSLAITVGGDTYLSSTATASGATEAALRTQSGFGSSSGTIQLSFTGATGRKALLIQQISVVYIPPAI